MVDDTTPVAKKLEDMRRQAMARLEEARGLVSQMNIVELVFDLPLTVLADLETSAVTTPPLGVKGSIEPWGNTPQKRRSLQSIRPDEFLGEEPMKAAKKYMAGVGHAIHFDEIADAVQKGGAAIGGSDWRDRLELSLKRSPYEVISVAEKTYGLREFYTPEQMNRLKASRRGNVGKRSISKKKKSGKPRGRPSQVAKKKAVAKSKNVTKGSPGEAQARKRPGRPPKRAVETAKIENAATEHVH